MWNQAKHLQNLLKNAGYETLAAGGCVRDHLLGRPPQDIDLATTATPDEVMDTLRPKGITCIETGLKHGTITAIVEGNHFEITTLRHDKACFGRKAEVQFIKSFEEDAKRRDFTINALFMDLNDNNVIYDYVGVQEDLKKRLLRVVGDAEVRIREDYLRILRFFRFASQLKFKLHPPDINLCLQYCPYLTYLSAERVRDEFTKLLQGPAAYTILERHREIVFAIFPELLPTNNFPQVTPYHCYDVYTHSIKSVEAIQSYKNKELSFAALFHDVAKPFCWSRDEKGIDHFYGHDIEGEKIVERIGVRLKFSNESIRKIKFFVRHHMAFLGTPGHGGPGEKSIRRLICKCDEEFGAREMIFELLSLHIADNAAQRTLSNWAPVTELIALTINKVAKEEFKSPLSGKDILTLLGDLPGEQIGALKNHLKKLVIDGKLSSHDTVKAKELAFEWMASIINAKKIIER